MRVLTTKFSTYKLGKYEKATGKGVIDLLDIGNLEVSKIAEIIKLGNTFPKGCDEDEEAYNKRQLVKIPEHTTQLLQHPDLLPLLLPHTSLRFPS